MHVVAGFRTKCWRGKVFDIIFNFLFTWGEATTIRLGKRENFSRFSSEILKTFKSFHDGGRYRIETSPLICSAKRLTGFYMITTSVMKELRLTTVKILKRIKLSKRGIHLSKIAVLFKEAQKASKSRNFRDAFKTLSNK